MEGTDAEALKQATERLSQAAMKIGEAMYKAEQASRRRRAPGGAGAAGRRRPAGRQGRRRRVRGSRRQEEEVRLTGRRWPVDAEPVACNGASLRRRARWLGLDLRPGHLADGCGSMSGVRLTGASRAGIEGLRWRSRIITPRWAWRGTRARTTSRRPIASSRCSTTRTAIRATSRPRPSSRKSAKPTTS